uniref:N-alpha-acetyltransferase 40 n=1 Tax=Mesocestoides corti TaxID=53468 RepID=A0A5K3FQK7_MESCO
MPQREVAYSTNKYIVNAANALSSKEILKKSFNSSNMIVFESCCLSFLVKCFGPAELPPDQREKIFFITEHNMKNFYLKSTWGWDDETKRNELFAPESRLLVCYLRNVKARCDLRRHKSPPSLPVTSDDPCAFVHFRFEIDAGRPILYCYEIQLHEKVRGFKLGRKLMDILLKISIDNRMSRILLTVFKFNTVACTFFRKLGFKIDHTDPSKFGLCVDYSILSRRP